MDDQVITQNALEVGDIYCYRGSEHCRHGLAIITSDGLAHDTYWEGFSLRPRGDVFTDAPLWHIDHLAKLTPENKLGNIADFDKSDRDTCELYKDSDSIYLPIGGGSAVWYLRRGAKPDLQRSIDFTRSKMTSRMYEAKSAARDAVELLQELDRLTRELWEQEHPASPESTLVR